LKIGDIHIERNPLLLAPMEDITDRSFRQVCKKFGADMLYTEFVASEALIRNIDKSIKNSPLMSMKDQ
jgi:tRNA-dihydrouridine synthase B